jgi:hypothetical protein
MDIVAAASVTLKYVNNVLEGPVPDLDIKDPTLQVPHQIEVLEKIINGEVTGEKAHRWIGWAQCALTINGIGDMNVYRAINYAC